jgi:hypothetical protein
MSLGIAIAAGALLLLASSKPKPKQGPVRVDVGPVKILPSKPAARPAASTSPVRVVVPEKKSDSLLVAALAAKQASGSPLRADPVAARKGAQPIADHVRQAKAKYDRVRVAAWQVLAGLAPDGLYGPATASALRQLGAKNVTGAMFKGSSR